MCNVGRCFVLFSYSYSEKLRKPRKPRKPNFPKKKGRNSYENETKSIYSGTGKRNQRGI